MRDVHADGDKTAPKQGPDTIAVGNKKLRKDKRSDDSPDDEDHIGESLADKSAVTAPMHDAADPINNARKVPGVDPDNNDAMRDESLQEID